MKKIQYGTIPTKEQVRHELIAAFLIFFVVGNFITLLFYDVLDFFGSYHIAATTLMIVGFVGLYFYKQHLACKEMIVFDESGYTCYQYPNQLYLAIFLNKKPMQMRCTYEEAGPCTLSYQKADHHQHNEYTLTFAFSNQTLCIQPNHLSKTNLKYLLLLLSNKVKEFQDPDQLQLCLIQDAINIDTYLYRVEERKKYENE